MDLTVLTVRRAGVPSSCEAHAGYESTIPPEEFPAKEPGDEADLAAFADELGWAIPVPPGVNIDVIRTPGLVEPSDWEALYLRWLAGRLGVSQGVSDACDVSSEDGASERGVLRDQLVPTSTGKKPGLSPDSVPDGSTLRKADTPRGEARAVAYDIRHWLEGTDEDDLQRSCDDVLVLVPGDRASLQMWCRELERVDLPVDAARYESLATTGVARAIIKLSRLTDWGSRRISRRLIRDIFLSRYWSASAIGERFGPSDDSYRRRLVRRAIASLRRNSFTFGEWTLFIRKLEMDGGEDNEWGATREALLEFSRFLRGCTGPKYEFFRNFSRLFDTTDETGLIRGAVAAMGDDDTASRLADFDQVRDVVQMLARRETELDASNDDIAGMREPAETLRNELARRFCAGRSSVVTNGVQLLPHGCYDGRVSRRLFVGGLGEGSFPRVPRLWSRREERWARKVGLLTEENDIDDGPEAPIDYVVQEVERQIRLAVRAVDAAEGDVTFSYAAVNRDGDTVHPGPMLSLLTGGWDKKTWTGEEQRELEGIERFRWADEVPDGLDALDCWRDAALFANFDHVVETLADADERGESLREVHEKLRAGRRHTQEGNGTTDRLGPHVGRLPDNPQPRRRFSASSLSDYGQCGARYFYGRVLGLDDEEEAEDSLSALEIGNLLHTAFFQAAQKYVRVGENGELQYWKLTYSGDSKEDAVEEITSEVAAHLDKLIEEHLDAHQSLSAPLAQEIRRRWHQALAEWVRKHIKQERRDRTDEIEHTMQEARERAEQQRRDAGEIFDRLERYLGEKNKYVQARATDKFKPEDISGLTQKQLKQVLAHDDEDSARRELSKLRGEFEDEVKETLNSTLNECREKRDRLKKARPVEQFVLHTELAFGLSGDLNDPTSVPEPIEITVGESTVQLTGSIDRVDFDPATNSVAARDYKSSRNADSSKVLQTKMESGEHLQLPIYALALEQLIEDGALPHLEGATVELTGLEYPAVGRNAVVELNESVGRLRESDELVNWKELGELWIDHHVQAIRNGLFMPLPTSCPIHEPFGGAYCDYSDVCTALGHPLDESVVDDPRIRPDIRDEDDSEDSDERLDIAVELPTRERERTDAENLRTKHRRARELALDVARPETVISAGAGTGKTYSLVERYLRCLADGASPQQILAITFTRKAAAEMKQRIRAALLSRELADTELQQVVKELEADPRRLREIVLQLSAAPISTIDSLAGDILRHVDEIREASGAATGHDYEIVSKDSVKSQLEVFVAEKFFDGLDDGDQRLRRLANAVSVEKLRVKLRDAVVSGVPDELCLENIEDQRSRVLRRQALILDSWAEIMEPVQSRVVDVLRQSDPYEWRALLDEARSETALTKSIDPEVVTEVEAGIEALKQLRNDTCENGVQIRDALQRVCTITTTGRSKKNSQMGRNSLREALRDVQSRVRELVENTGTTEEQDAWKKWKSWEDIDDDAYLAACVLDLVEEWQSEFRDRLERRGVLRYGDVERLATEALRDDTIGPELADRLPFRHIFVDEAQDTSESQVDLIRALRTRLAEESDDQPPHIFWVGDYKQSIYRFRGAEVDVFAAMVDEMHDGDGNIDLTVNWRSRPELLKVMNRLFSSILSPSRNGEELDPTATMDYQPLTWPEDCEFAANDAPAVEIIAEPGKYFGDTDDDADREDAAEALESALGAKVRDLVEERSRRGWDGAVAILVKSWRRAEHYREVMEQSGIVADVQGGRGLLTTPEILLLRQWLEAAAHTDRIAPRIAAVQGAGFGLSFAGLYCLRRGIGIDIRDDAPDFAREYLEERRGDGDEPTRLNMSVLLGYGVIDPEAAMQEWSGADEDTREVLGLDAEVLERFQHRFDWLKQRLTATSSVELLEELVEQEGLLAHWFDGPRGAQKVANVETFFDLVRGFESDRGVDPRALHRHLNSIADSDDPAAGGLDASRGAAVIITTYWQAKGREWPAVVLPDIHKTDMSVGDAFGAVRVVRRTGGKSEPIHTAAIRRTPNQRPFNLEKRPVSSVLDVCRRPNSRAELRRLLYVAVTRAKHRVVISGEFNATDKKDVRAIDPTEARNWAMTLRAATGLGFDEQGRPSVPEDSPVFDLIGDDAPIQLLRAEDASTDAEVEAATDELDPSSEELKDLRQRVSTWETFDTEKRQRQAISELPRETDLPEPSEFDPDCWPGEGATSDIELFSRQDVMGTAFHYAMEQWCFGCGTEMGDELLVEALERAKFDVSDDGRTSRAIYDLRQLIDKARENLRQFNGLSEAAERGDVFHEVAVRFIDPGTGDLLVGDVDLVWRDADRAYHVVDYKTGSNHPVAKGDEDPLAHDGLQKHFAQVAAYTRGLASVLETPVVDFGLWYVPAGLVVRWTGDCAERPMEQAEQVLGEAPVK